MNSIGSIITRLQEQYDSSNKSHKGKIMSGAKERATKRYFKDAASRERRKKGKSRFDTFRREEQPDEKDLRLEDIHFANFLGVKDTVVGVPYNNTHIDEPVNIIECDILRHEPKAETVSENISHVESEESDYGSWASQISREPNTKWYMNWIYETETQSLTGYSTFKREHDGDADDQPAKRMRSEFDALSRMEEGLLTSEIQQEENNFAAMLAYMKEQVALAEKMFVDELTPCDCCC
jgi:hypothetical protein